MISLTPNQNKIAAAGITVTSAVLVFAFVVVLGWGLLLLLERVAAAIVPVILGIFLAMLFKPYYSWFVKKVRNPTLAFALMFLSLAIPFACIVWFSGTFLVDQVTAFGRAAPTLLARMSHWVNLQFPHARELFASWGFSEDQLLFFTDPAKFSQEALSQLSAAYGISAVKAGVGALRYLSSVGTAFVTLIFFVFFLMRPSMNGRDYMRFAPFLKEETRAFVANQIDAFVDILVSFFQRQVVICLIEGILYGMGFMLVGLPYGFILGFLLGTLNLVPLLGTVIILPLVLPIAFFGDGGSVLRLVGVTGVWIVGQVLDGYLITPTIQGNKTGLGFAGVIFSFLFWGVVFQSLLGLLLAIPLSAFCVVLWRAVTTRYVKALI